MTAPAPKRKQRSGGQKKPFKIYEIKSLIARFVQEKKFRDLAMFTTGIDTMLRASDLLNLRVHDVLNETTGQMKQSFSVLQIKTRRTESPTQNPKPPKSVTVELSPACQTALFKWIRVSGKTGDDFLFTGLRKSKHTAITGKALTKIVQQWAFGLGLDGLDYGAHSLRRTNAVLIYEKTNNPAVVMGILGHGSLTSTNYYLGIDQKKALDVARVNKAEYVIE